MENLWAAKTSNGTGNWSTTTTWLPTGLPVATDSVTIRAADTVTVDIANATCSTMSINGTARFSRIVSSTLTIVGGNVNVNNGGTLDMGTAGSPINASSATLVLPLGAASGKYGLIISTGGNFLVYGAVKTSTASASVNLAAGASNVTVSNVIGWAAKDQIAVDSEVVTISNIAGNVVTFTPSLGQPHFSTQTIVVDNLSRSVIIKSTLPYSSGNGQPYTESFVQNATSFNLNYGEFRNMGANSAGLYGVTLEGVAQGSLQSCAFVNNQCGLYLDGATNVSVKGNAVKGSKLQGIVIAGSSNTVAGNDIVGHGTAGSDYGLYLQSASSNVITGNRIAVIGSYGIYDFSGTGNTISSNTASASAPFGGAEIYLQSSAASEIIQWNKLYASNGGGLVATGVSNIVQGNSVSGSYGVGISLSVLHNSVVRNNTVFGGQDNGIFMGSGNQNIVMANNVFSNVGTGVIDISGAQNLYALNVSSANATGLYFGPGNTAIGETAFLNTGQAATVGSGATLVNCNLGYSSAAVSLPDTGGEVSASGGTLEFCKINPTNGGILRAPLNSQGSYVVNYSTTIGVMQISGDYQVINTTLSVTTANELFASTYTPVSVVTGAEPASNFTLSALNDTNIVGQVITVTYNGSNWVVTGSSTPNTLCTISSGGSANCPGSNTQFNLSVGNTAALSGDFAMFGLLPASNDAGVQKKLQFGPAATSGSPWNNNSGRSKIEVDVTGGLTLTGSAAIPVLVDMASGSTFYSFVDSGAFTVSYASVTNMDENGIWLNGSGPFSINSSTFDYFGNGLNSTSTLFTLNNVTNSTITLNDVTYGESRLNTKNYNYTILGSSSGVSWTNQQYSGTLTGDANERSDPGNHINWSTTPTYYWIAGSAAIWSNSANWSATSGGATIGSVPTTTANVIFDGNGKGNCTFDVAVNVSSLTLSTSTLGGYSGLVDTSSNTVSILSFTENYGTFYARTSTMTINGSLGISSGAFNANGSTITIQGNMTVGGGATFSAGSSTVAFCGVSGSTDTMTGSITFYNLSATQPGLTLQLPSGSTETVSRLLNLTGSSSNRLFLTASTPGVRAFVNNSGSNSVSWVSTRDNNASLGTTIRAGTSSMDLGNNVNWSFGGVVNAPLFGAEF